ncbi:hypothetical protein WR25_06306 [Diploscapter pachys]|uniref:Uncharacterized protein n=1 Tax=Diploscapter pachys TaxID=2018661 RepID=A0A2A2M1M1_9BILA|nr:hypothetical protein WR25_06306 [Diploscapter pachys]
MLASATENNPIFLPPCGGRAQAKKMRGAKRASLTVERRAVISLSAARNSISRFTVSLRDDTPSFFCVSLRMRMVPGSNQIADWTKPSLLSVAALWRMATAVRADDSIGL